MVSLVLDTAESVGCHSSGGDCWLNPAMSWRGRVGIAVVLGGLLVAPGTSPVVAAPHHASYARAAGPVRAQITFIKNYRHPWDSVVTWQASRRGPSGHWHVMDIGMWRAGSGFGGPLTENPCAKGRGWLPDGRYSLIQYDDYPGTLIHGRVFRLADKRCRNGTLREQLFLHTETGAGNRQCPNVPGDHLCRWEFPGINDYRSSGCIKMSPTDLLSLTRHFHRFFAAGVPYASARVSLVVR